AFNRTFPLTEMSWSIFASKVLPTASFEEMRLTVRTVSVVPAGMVAANEDCAAIQVQLAIVIRTNVFLIIFRFLNGFHSVVPEGLSFCATRIWKLGALCV